MAKYVINQGEYFGMEPETYSVEADDVRQLLVKLLGDPDGDNKEFDKVSTADLIKEFKNSNGDGQPFLTVFDVDNDRMVPELHGDQPDDDDDYERKMAELEAGWDPTP